MVQKIFMHHQPTALIPSSLHLTAPEPNCTSWKNGGTCTLGDEAMLAASVSAGKDGVVQAKLVNYGEQTVRLRVDHGSGQRCAVQTERGAGGHGAEHAAGARRELRLQHDRRRGPRHVRLPRVCKG